MMEYVYHSMQEALLYVRLHAAEIGDKEEFYNSRFTQSLICSGQSTYQKATVPPTKIPQKTLLKCD